LEVSSEGGALMERRPIHPGLSFGDVITEVDLSAELDAVTWARIEAALVERGVLIFKNQGSLTVLGQRKFASLWGHMDGHGAIPVLPISNVRRSGHVLQAGTNGHFNLRGNEGWHIDNTYQPRSAKVGILRAERLPSGGSHTAFCDGWAGFDALDKQTRTKILGLSAYHSGLYSQAKLGQDPTGATLDAPAPGGIYLAKAYLRPLVKIHPVTGRRGLHIGRHAFGIPGMSAEASDELLSGLLRHAASEPSRCYYHQWAVGDLVVWDNRRVLHRATASCPAGEPRVFHGNRIGGDESEAAINASDPAPGQQQLERELARIATQPELVQRELALRSYFDSHVNGRTSAVASL
jgi:alpha-ketoglutarate-dependent taurine dioxygenase